MTMAQRNVWLALAAALGLIGIGFDLDQYALLDPDEGRNAEVMREMAESNDYVLPRLNALPYVDKPVLFFAAGALAMEVLGPTVLAARLPSLLFTLATLALVGWFAHRLFDARAAWAAAIATASTPFALAYSRTVIFDSALTFFVVAALAAFYCAIEARSARLERSIGPGARNRSSRDGPPIGRFTTDRWLTVVAWAAMGLGVLTKGPVAIAVPLLVAVPYAIWRRRVRRLVDPLAILLFFAIVGPWVLAVSREVPGFLHHSLVTETVLRLTTTQLHRTGPAWYFLVILPAAAFPWSIVVLGGARSWRLRQLAVWPDRRAVFLILWIVAPLVFFTLSQSKRPQYILPLIPAIGLLVAAVWHRAKGQLPGARSAAVLLAALALGLLLGRDVIAQLIPAGKEVAAAIPPTSLRLATVCAFAAALAWFAADRREILLVALALPAAAIPVVSGRLMEGIAHQRSASQLAAVVETVLTPETQIVGIEAFPLSLPFYLQRPIVLSTSTGRELTSNYLERHLDFWRRTPGSVLRPADWWREALLKCTRPRVFIVRSEDRTIRAELEQRISLLAESRKYAAYGTCGLTDLAMRGP